MESYSHGTTQHMGSGEMPSKLYFGLAILTLEYRQNHFHIHYHENKKNNGHFQETEHCPNYDHRALEANHTAK